MVYAVIMAGGGGTRLWPLSTPERPKPFLPLFPDGTLFQKTIARILGPDLDLADITVVASGAYAELARAQVDGVRILEEPEGRNTAAAIALAAVAIERDDDEVMIVLPADHLISAEDVFRACWGARPRASRRAASGSRIRWSRSGSKSTAWPPSMATSSRTSSAERSSGRSRRTRFGRSRRSRMRRERSSSAPPRASPGTPGCSCGVVGRSGGLPRVRAGGLRPDRPRLGGRSAVQGYAAARAISIDYAVMEPAAAAHRVVMASMDVGWSDLGSWTVLLEALGGIGVGRVVQPGESAEAGPDDLVVERVDGRLLLTEGPRGILAQTPVALLAGARPARDIVVQLLDRAARQEA